MSICRLCKQRPPEVRAHIIPRWCFREVAGDGDAVKLSPEGTVLKTRIGEYDRGLVCAACEARFGEADRYAAAFFRDRDWSKSQFQEGGDVDGTFYWYRNELDFDYDKIKLFILAVLWRASESTRSFYSEVRLGARGDQIAKRILSGDSFLPHEFPCMIMREFVPEDDPLFKPDQLILSPYVRRGSDGIWRATLPITGFIFLLTTDQRASGQEVDAMTLSPERLVVVGRPYGSGGEIRALARTVVENMNNKNQRQLSSDLSPSARTSPSC